MTPKKPAVCKAMVINGSAELLELFREILDTAPTRQFVCSLHALADAQHIEAIRNIQPDILLIDQPFNDPEFLGWELVQQIRLARDLRHIPIVFMTTNLQLMRDLEAQLISLNVRVLLKPFDPDHLLLQINDALDDNDTGTPYMT